tara:strand:+ start:1944 stop:2906 length:963 start_codon:yes stop_codon:yes gene_type:complete
MSNIDKYEDIKAMAKDFHESGFFQSIKNPQQALVTIMAGRELGMGPFEAMSNIYVIQGRPAYYAHKYGDMIKRTGKYNFKVEKLTETECVIDFTEDGKSVGKSEFTMDDAKKAGLGGVNWTKYPRNMLYARAITNGARWYCPDAFNGAAYEPSELGAEVEFDEQGTQTIISVPDEDVVVKDATTSTETANDVVTAPDAVTGHLVLEVDKDMSRPGLTITQAADFEIGSFVERESTTGNKMGSISIITAYTLPAGVVARWDEFTVSPMEFADKTEMYRSLQAGDKIRAKLSFEAKMLGGQEKNYMNISVIMVYPKDELEQN